MEFLEDDYGCLHVCGCGVCFCLSLCVVCVLFFACLGFCVFVWLCGEMCCVFLGRFLRCCVQGCVSSDLFGVVVVCVCLCWCVRLCGVVGHGSSVQCVVVVVKARSCVFCCDMCGLGVDVVFVSVSTNF